MNVRNVLILADLIRELDGDHSLGAGALAEKLAARGVLAPSALTEDQATAWPFDGEYIATDSEVAQQAGKHREALEHLAKGEPVG